jgi:hypothetical protein
LHGGRPSYRPDSQDELQFQQQHGISNVRTSSLKTTPMKPSEKEEHFFRTHELKARLQKAAEEQQKIAEMERHRLRELHWMHCPKCGQKLDQEHYGTVEVDVCPSCKGLWLDANELEAIFVAETNKGNLFQKFLKVLRA